MIAVRLLSVELMPVGDLLHALPDTELFLFFWWYFIR